jgi:transposase, IS6 family
MTSSGSSSVFAGFRFPREVIAVAVRWYLRYGLSYRDVEELLADRGVTADHVTVYQWVQRFTPEFIEAARLRRHAPGDRWFVDETYVKVSGRRTYLYRAIDQYGQVIDVVPAGNSIVSLTCSFRLRGWCGDGWLTRCCSRSPTCSCAGYSAWLSWCSGGTG